MEREEYLHEEREAYGYQDDSYSDVASYYDYDEGDEDEETPGYQRCV